MTESAAHKLFRILVTVSTGVAISCTLEAATAAGAKKPAAAPATKPAVKSPTTRPSTRPADKPCLTPTTGPTTRPAAGDTGRFAIGSPFDHEYKPPKATGGKQIWAYSCLWEKAPKLEVQKWLTAKPKTKGKFVLIEFWATWCPPCRKSIGLLNRLHKKHGKDLVVIGISHETEADVRALKTPRIEYFSAIDTKARTKKKLGVFGIPHVILIEPGGCVVWEGFPLLKDHELTEKIVAKMIAIGRKSGSLK